LDAVEAMGDDSADLQRALCSDEAAWVEWFSTAREIGRLSVERNVLRYSVIPVQVRLADDRVLPLVRVVAAGLRAGSAMGVTSAVALPHALRVAFADLGVPWCQQTEEEWLAEIRSVATRREEHRVRLVATDVRRLREARRAIAVATRGWPGLTLHSGPVTEAGRLELLPFLREQAISVTSHRFGAPDRLVDGLP
jgi:RHH-type proline utilization regulon transcriptional repressor/proline dehydrogenase/delta 1-pyrroline-5-carboxylate dehydrogenase